MQYWNYLYFNGKYATKIVFLFHSCLLGIILTSFGPPSPVAPPTIRGEWWWFNRKYLYDEELRKTTKISDEFHSRTTERIRKTL